MTPLAPLGARVTIVDRTPWTNHNHDDCLHYREDCPQPTEHDAVVTGVHLDGSIDLVELDESGDDWTLHRADHNRGDYDVHVVAVWAPAPVVLPEMAR